MIVAALLVLVAGLATGGVARSSARARPPLAAHFPGQPEEVSTTPLIRLRAWAAGAAIDVIAVVVLVIVQAPFVALVVAVAGAAALTVMTVVIHRHARGCSGVQTAIDQYAPRIAVPYAGKVGVHIGMWSPWIDRTDVPWCIVARTPALFHELAAMYDTPIVQGAIPTTVRGALYPHGAAANADVIATSAATHVFLGHGDSDKPLSASERVLQYDLVAVAGQAAIDRFKASGLTIPPERIRVIGRPQTEGIKPAGSAIPTPATVLYAPTWRHADDALNVSSLLVADSIVQALLDRGCTVVFRRHFAGQNHVAAEAMIAHVDAMLQAHAAASGKLHRWGAAAMAEPLITAFNSVDAMVSDVSGIVVDFMASGKPLVMYAAQHTDPEAFRASHPTAEAAYVIDRDLVGLGAAPDAALGDDPLASSRAERADYYLGGADRADPARRFMDLIVELAGA
ncbi:CDP-glycerol glycerophosphotransferase family protein [Aeromicrobium sp.]|uniref:CDP-glycerol glycerophosphotransferase family protein n=1 Tax=Aeromicrobium sp. TaxID=1871063 RepID=UPI0019AE89DF|nr:CDP-glycerol glycerophosphotransferase family protein [Aeromicrobium sp.]MBC7632202.1 CDP-glycerol glycerophosphotransferase family protein [Aeromicrobium sp.]